MIILKEIVGKMSGWEPPENLTESMMTGLSGGAYL